VFHKIHLDLNFIELNNLKAALNFIERRGGGTGPAMEEHDGRRPGWIEVLEPDDAQFLKRFLLASGSLKALAQEYDVSYPTIRARLDRLIAKVKAAEDPRVNDPFERKLRLMVADAKLSPAVARELLAAHRDAKRNRKE
jgi:hypothetical protein